MIGLMLDIGNIIFFISNLPQLITAYKNRTNLQGLSAKMLFGFILSTIFFIVAGVLANAYLTVILGILNIFFFLLQLHWKCKYK